jgi:hypothetical protein
MRRTIPACIVLFLLAATGFAQEIPAGTVLPVMTNRRVDSRKSKPGDRISARLMQDVTLPSGEQIRAGAKLDGRVVETTAGSTKGASRLIVRFDRLVFDKKELPVTVSLRALASTQDVFSAQLPTSNFDEYGTSTSDWTTVQVGGAAVYLGDGTVRDAMDIVGRAPGYGTVTAKLLPAPKRGCPAVHVESEREQSLWVFSPWACGTYGFEDLNIAHHGTTPPVGTIELTSTRPIQVRGGSGWLLRVVAAPVDTPSPAAN